MASLHSRIVKWLLSTVFWLLVALPTFGEAIDKYQVARWTFENGSLQGAPADFLFEKGGGELDQPVDFKDGWLQMGPGSLLSCSGVSSEKCPDLSSSVTLWVRFRFDSVLPLETAFLFGLTSSQAPGDWQQMILGLLYRVDHGALLVGPYGQMADNRQIGVSNSRLLPAKVGEDLVAALAFDGTAGTAVLSVNGVCVVKDLQGGGQLAPFTGFNIGRLKATGGMPVSVREVRIYSIALTPQWIDEVTASALGK